MEPYFYSTASLQTYSAYQMISLFGINTETTAVQILNLNGFYPVQESSPDFDLKLYNTTSVWNLVSITGGQGAELSWTAVPKPLPEAKANGSVEVKQQADGSVSEILTVNYVTGEVIASVASQDLIDRPASLQVVLDETTTVTDNLGAQLDAIAAATTVDEINNIVNKPTGVLFTGRGGGLGPLDLNVSYYNAFNSVSMTEAETELFVPGTSTVISYGSGGPNAFDSLGNCFVLGDYLLQIREVATGSVIAEFECPLNPAGENVPFNGAPYNPTPPIPANTFNVTNNGSGNYVINGASNPTLTLAGGITYTFNINAVGHPFWIKTTQTTGTANIYNTGVTNNGTDNGVITFVVPSTGVPSTLYYNCQYHASMAGVLNMLP